MPRHDRLGPKRRGRLITLEGADGAGKSTQAALLATALREMGLSVLSTREPGGSPGAEKLRSLLLSGEVEWSPRAETLLHFAARAEHVEKVIRPALAAGTWVVCDRFTNSTMAYQGYGQGVDRRMIAGLAKLVGLEPDLTIILDVSEAVAAARLVRRGGAVDRYERLGAGFQGRVREGLREIARGEPARCMLIPAEGTAGEVHQAILAALRARLPHDCFPED